MKTAILLVLALAACERTSDLFCTPGHPGYDDHDQRCTAQTVDGGGDVGPDAFTCPVDGAYDPTTCTDPTAPICSTSAGGCVPCTADAQCPSQVCFRETGECATDDTTAYVDPAFTGTPSNDCTQAAPCTSWSHAQTVGKTHYYLLSNVTETAQFTTNAVIAAKAGVGISAQTDVTHPAAIVVSGGHLILSDITLTGTGVDGGTALSVASNGTARAARVHFTNNSVADVKSSGNLTVNNCEFLDNHDVALVVSAGTYAVTNSLFTQVVSGGIAQPPVQVTGAGTFEFNTMSKYNISGARAKGVECVSGGTIAYNIIWGQIGAGLAASITATDCTAHTNLVDKADTGDTMELTSTTTPFGTATDETQWIPKSTSNAIGAATGATISGDLSTDHLGAVRPSPAGSLADLGAFESPN